MRNPELYRAANRNLVRLASGEIRRELAAEKAARRRELTWAQEQAAERRKLKALVKSLREELAEHRKNWDFLYELDDLGDEGGPRRCRSRCARRS
jgi:uncharacterized protein YaiL (DUF2058 family)